VDLWGWLDLRMLRGMNILLVYLSFEMYLIKLSHLTSSRLPMTPLHYISAKVVLTYKIVSTH